MSVSDNAIILQYVKLVGSVLGTLWSYLFITLQKYYVQDSSVQTPREHNPFSRFIFFFIRTSFFFVLSDYKLYWVSQSWNK